MANDISSMTFDLECPACGTKASKTVRDVETRPVMACAKCAQPLDLNPVKREIANMRAQLGKLFK